MAATESVQDQLLELKAKIQRHAACIGIIGLGYVGLPLARAFSARSFPVLGFDVDALKVEKLNRGESYIGHIGAEVIGQMRRHHFEATSTFGRLGEADVIVICVPTPLTDSREPDLSFIMNSARAIAANLRPGQLIVLESTTYPGTTRDEVLPVLAATGLTAGQDFFLAFSPEREDPGNPSFSHADDPQGRRRASTGELANSARELYAADRRQRRAAFRRPKSPKRARSWRTPTGRSTSRWSTS